MYIEKPVLGQITQGTIFTAVTAESYLNIPVWGLCITARCDVAHENKARVFNYLPVLRYEDWILQDGAYILIERIWSVVFGKAKEFLVQKGKSSSVLDSYPPVQIAKNLFPDARDEKDLAKFLEIASKLEKISEARRSIPLSKKSFSEIASLDKKVSEKTIKELWANQLQGYYFLPNIGETEHSSSCGYVVLLREVHHVSRNLANAVARGISKQDTSKDAPKSHVCNFSVFDFAYPTGKIQSPWVEHLMQQFSLLFSRIGLPDPAEDSLNILIERINNV
jgi:hypothetical protein